MASKLTGLVDNFPGSTLDATKWAPINTAPTTLSDNQYGFPCTTSYPEIQTVTTWDLTSSQLSLGVTPPDLVAGVGMAVAAQQNASNSISWVLQVATGGSALLIARKIVASVSTDLTRLVYDAGAHGWWRLREQNGYAYWDTSPNGQFWQNQYSTPTTGLDLSNITVRILCGTTGEASWVLYGDGLYGDGIYGGGSG